ncbi:tRNA (adenosine(37)-N6)-dimethylallyltransferase MiaA [bacterium]|nr:tRNA (adenosine(37)-N6)-dimethylallyltransferase MiaA [bacterium]|tara:strand:- start:22274 stop:23179 length:906 start_codon:yes stop_codon:yes gene_type:complete
MVLLIFLKMRSRLKKILLFGPTASGKTSLSILLAKKIDAEIINIDSRLFYRGMNIGTAKPSKIEMDNISHHLIDIADPDVQLTAGEWLKSFEKIFNSLQRKKRNIILVGGTGFYVRILEEGWDLGATPPDHIKRKELLDLEKAKPGSIFSLLKKVDFKSSEKINENDLPRLIRAIEISKSGLPVGEKEKIDFTSFYLDTPKDILDRRIEKRTAMMFSKGLEEEFKNLVKKYGKSSILTKTIGYAEFFDSEDLDSVFEKIKTNTRRLAKKQRTWGRGLSLDFKIDGKMSVKKQIEFIIGRIA